MKRSLLWIGAVTVLVVAPAFGGGETDWPQWRGPDRNGISAETAWESVGRELWSADVGLGYSGVVVRGERLYTLGHDKDKKLDMIQCMEAATGRPLWKHTFTASLMAMMHGGGTLTTPSVDGDLLFVLNREGKFFCMGAADGQVKWFKQLTQSLDVKPPQWGFASSPLVLEDGVVLNVGRIVKFDKTTGRILWSTEDYGGGYCTPSVITVGGRECLAAMGGEELVVIGVDDGKTLFTYPWKTDWKVNAASPVSVGDRLFISSGYNHGCALLDLSGKEPEVVWENKQMRNKMATSVFWHGHFYGFDESMLKCLDIDGDEKWRERGSGMGALMLADGRLIYLARKGELVVATASPEGYEELSRVDVLEDGVFWTAPVLAGGRIYCRSSKGKLVCRDHRPQKATDSE